MAREEYIQEHIGSNGEIFVYLKGSDNRVHKCMLARIVLETFIGPPPSSEHKPFHKDGNKQNNCADNLEWRL